MAISAARLPWYRRVPLARALAAVLGGYALASLCSVAVLLLPLPPSEAVMLGMLTGFSVHAAAAVWAFAARTATRAWIGVGLTAVVLGAACLQSGWKG